jgi:hypothetical protein
MQSHFGHNEMNNGVLRKTMTNSNYYDNKKRRKKEHCNFIGAQDHACVCVCNSISHDAKFPLLPHLKYSILENEPILSFFLSSSFFIFIFIYIIQYK